MTITYKHASGDIILCHGTAHRGESGYYTGPLGNEDTARTEWQTQTVLAIRALTAKHLDRANGSHAYAFRVERRFNSEAEAIIHAATLLGSIHRAGGSLTITGIGTAIITMPSAVLRSLNTSRTGCSLDIAFEFATSTPTVTGA